MLEKINIEIDIEFLNLLFSLSGTKTPSIESIDLMVLKDTVKKIQEKMSKIQASTDLSSFSNIDEENDSEDKKKILIVDDLGVITYQLNVLFRKTGFSTIIAKEIYDAIEKFKKNDVSIVVMDLFIPTEREGFILLDELIKMVKLQANDTKIGVMTASNKKEYKQICLKRGADFFIEKNDTWQKSLVDICYNLISDEKTEIVQTK